VGTTWRDGGFSAVDNRFFTRGALAAVAIRDNRGQATSIAPYQASLTGGAPIPYFSPAAQDGQLRADLFASVRVNGQWVQNPNPNLGFWLIGAFEDRGGPERRPNVRHDEQMILQSTMPFDSDLTSEGMTLQFTGVETLKPLMRRLRMNLPLSDDSGNPIVEDPGQVPFVLSKPTDADFIPRQLLLFFGRRKAGKMIYTCEGYPLANLVDIGNFRRSKTDADAASMQFMALPDSYHVDLDPANPTSGVLVPAFYSEWTFGDGWVAIGGTPAFPGVSPAATAIAGKLAHIVLPSPTGGAAPYTLTVASTPAEATLHVDSVTPNSPTTGQTTIAVSGLTAAQSDRFTVTATGTNGVAASSTQSNAITVLT
jgi:hypothetical protein